MSKNGQACILSWEDMSFNAFNVVDAMQLEPIADFELGWVPNSRLAAKNQAAKQNCTGNL